MMTFRRERQLYDVIEIAALYSHHKMLTNLSENDDNYWEEASTELSIVAMIPYQAARRVLSLVPVRNVPGLWKYFEQHPHFRVFAARDFCVSGYKQQHGQCELLEVDFLRVLCSTQTKKGGFLAETVSKISRRFRDRLVLFFFQITGVLATISGWCREEDLILTSLQDILRRYLCVSWNSDRMSTQHEESFSWDSMAIGWRTVAQSLLSAVKRDGSTLRDTVLSPGQEDTFLMDIARTALVGLLHRAFSMLVRKTPLKARRYVGSVSPLSKEVLKKMFHEIRIYSDNGPLEETIRSFEEKLSASLECFETGALQRREKDALDLPTHIPETPTESLEEVPGTPQPTPSKDPYEKRVRLRKLARNVRRRLEDLPASTSRTENSYRAPSSVQPSMRLRATPNISIMRPNARLTHNCNAEPDSIQIDEGMVGAQRVFDDPTPMAPEFLGQGPTWLGATGFSPRADENASNCMDDGDAVVPTFVEEVFQADGDGYCDQECGASCKSGQRQQLEEDYEYFCVELLRWNVDQDKSMSNLVLGDAEWFQWYASQNDNNILDSPTEISDVKGFANHWKSIMTMECRGQISNALTEKWPKVAQSREDFENSLQSTASFLVSWVKKVGRSRLITNLRCESTDVNLNEDIVKDLSGMSLGLGYLRSLTGRRSALMLVLVRRVHVEEGDRDEIGLSGKVDKMVFTASINREVGDYFHAETGHGLYIQSFYSLSSIARMFIAAHNVYQLPIRVQNIMFGPHPPVLRPEQVKMAESHDVRPLLDGVDPGCLRYLREIADHGALNIHQYESLVIALNQIGAAERDSSSMTMIHGPPGTGKTTCIVNLIGALIHHSQHGHVNGTATRNLLKRNDGMVRCSQKTGALKILVTAGSNQAVDNILRKLQKGVPNGKGGFLKVQAVRLARKGYDFKDISQHSINEKALPFDREHFHRPPPDAGTEYATRTSASSRARRALADEVVVFLTTNSLAGSASFLDLKQEVDVVISDEVSMLLETESLIPMTSTRKRSRFNRLHYIGVGDPRQLKAVSYTEQRIRKGLIALHFDYRKQTLSQFERLHNAQRVAVSSLVTQYRMNHVISTPHSRFFYKAAIKDGLPQSAFRTAYNQRASTAIGFYPLTFVDTSYCRSRREQDDGEGGISNTFEAREVEKLVKKIRSIANNRGHSSHAEVMKGKIAVIAPYREQVQKIRDVFPPPLMRELDLTVDTVDSMQGAERDVIIFSSTRSNEKGTVGFLTNMRRLNVTVSRARSLLIIVGDAEHLYDVPAFQFFISWCRDSKDGAGTITLHPAKGDEIAKPITRGGSMNLYRQRSGYELRPRRRISKPLWLGGE